MKKTVTSALLIVLAFSTFSSTLAQEKTRNNTRVDRKDRTEFGVVRAITDGSGVVIRWDMKSEVKTAGYNVFRVGDDSRELVNNRLIAGSWGRFGAATAKGEVYNVYDSLGTGSSNYVVEGQLIDGSRFTSKTVIVETVKDIEAETGTSTEGFRTAASANNSNVEQRKSELPSELRDLVSRNLQEPDPENQAWVAAQPGVKIGIKKDGFYRVMAAELLAAGFDLATDSTNWRLFVDGVEQSIIVPSGGQYVEFYGKAIDTPETNVRNYFLINGSVPGKRIVTRALRARPGSAISTRYSVSALKKERTTYFELLFNGELDNYLGGIFSDTPGTVDFTLTGVDFSVPTAEITINLYGFTDVAHSVRPRLNGNDLPLLTQHGKVFFWNTANIPTAFLNEGNNRLQLTASAPNDYNVFDNVEVKYDRLYQADENRISLFTPGYKKVDIKGFSSANTRVFDMTFDGNPILLSNIPVVADGTSFTAKIPSSRTMVAYAVEETGILQAFSVTENKPSTLSAVNNEADMLIISYSAPNFMAAAEEWATYRRSTAGGSFNVKVVDVTDVFDEFNYGTFGAAGIKSFLKYTSDEWQTPPRYVLFLGDASYDPRNYEGWGSYDLVPSQTVSVIARETASDDALADFDDDGFAELSVGRIPARTSAQITNALNKTILFEKPELQSFSRGALFAHDLPVGFDFEGMNQQMNGELPPGTPSTMVSYGEANSQNTLVNSMNTGKLIVNYSGHGSSGLWVNSGFFAKPTVPLLTNVNSPTIFSMLTCLNGFFIRPENGSESLAEDLLNHTNGGAVASWASTAETTPDIQLAMGLRFFDQMSDGPLNRMGDLVRDSKTVITFGADVRLSWVLLGDPALKVP